MNIRMRISGIFILFVFLLSGYSASGQEAQASLNGTVSYVTPQSVYVKFSSTASIHSGDTLFIDKGGRIVPAMVVRDLSSISCVCVSLSDVGLKPGDVVIHRNLARKTPVILTEPVPEKTPPSVVPVVPATDTTTRSAPPPALPPPSQSIRGHFTIGSYTDFATLSGYNTQRMRYTFSLNGRHIGNTNLSAECYLSFVHTNNNWDEVRNDIFNGLKVYSLAAGYDFGKWATVWFGRRMNPKIASMGASDGLQAEFRFKPFSVGVLVGFRPDYRNYGFNAGLFQAGAYADHEIGTKNGPVQSTLAFIEQTNSGKTDRRFLYLQHSNAWIKNLFFFGSAEIDLYRKELNTADSSLSTSTKPWLSNLYLSVSYRAFRKLYLSASYSTRQPVIYYESYKNFLEKILNDETLQGFTFQANYRPWTRFTLGLTAGYRFRQNDPRPSENLYCYATYNLPSAIGLSLTGSVLFLQSVYLNGNVYSAGISKEFAKGKLYTGLNYRYVDYRYTGNEYTVKQNIGEASLTWRIIRKLALSVNYEGTFETSETFNRIYAQLNLTF